MNSAIQRTESTVCCHPAAKGWEVASAFELVTFWFLSQETQPHDTQHTHFLCPFHVFFSPGSSFSFLPARVFVPFHEFQHSPFQLRKLRLQPDLHSKKKQKKNESVAPSVKHKPIFFFSFLFFSFFWHISEQFENEKQDLLALGQTGAFLLVCARTRAAFGLTSSPVKLTSGMTHWHLIKKEKRKIKYGPLEHFRCVIACKVHIKLIKFPKEIQTVVIQRRVFSLQKPDAPARSLLTASCTYGAVRVAALTIHTLL